MPRFISTPNPGVSFYMPGFNMCLGMSHVILLHVHHIFRVLFEPSHLFASRTLPIADYHRIYSIALQHIPALLLVSIGCKAQITTISTCAVRYFQRHSGVATTTWLAVHQNPRLGSPLKLPQTLLLNLHRYRACAS